MYKSINKNDLTQHKRLQVKNLNDLLIGLPKCDLLILIKQTLIMMNLRAEFNGRIRAINAQNVTDLESLNFQLKLAFPNSGAVYLQYFDEDGQLLQLSSQYDFKMFIKKQKAKILMLPNEDTPTQPFGTTQNCSPYQIYSRSCYRTRLQRKDECDECLNFKNYGFDIKCADCEKKENSGKQKQEVKKQSVNKLQTAKVEEEKQQKRVKLQQKEDCKNEPIKAQSVQGSISANSKVEQQDFRVIHGKEQIIAVKQDQKNIKTLMEKISAPTVTQIPSNKPNHGLMQLLHLFSEYDCQHEQNQIKQDCHNKNIEFQQKLQYLMQNCDPSGDYTQFLLKYIHLPKEQIVQKYYDAKY